MSTFGNTVLEAAQTTSPNGTGHIVAVLFTGGPTSGSLQSISFAGFPFGGSGTSGNIQLAVYGATTGNLIGNTSSFNPTGFTNQWYTKLASGTLSDSSGSYYIAWNVDSTASIWEYAYTSSGGNGLYNGGASTFGTWPSTPTFANTITSRLVSAYFTYTAGGAPITSGNMFAVL